MRSVNMRSNRGWVPQSNGVETRTMVREESAPCVERMLHPRVPVELAVSLAPLQHGPGDPSFQQTADGAFWRVSRLESGTVSCRLRQTNRHTINAAAWGNGAEEFLDGLPEMLCLQEDLTTFLPFHPAVAQAHRQHPGLRMMRTGQLYESLIPAILEQKVHAISAHRAWRTLVRRFGDPAPGPVPTGMRVPPDPETWRRIPSWEFHRANVGPVRAHTIVRAATRAGELQDSLARGGADEAARRLRSIPGIGPWTIAEVGQRVFGDADALSVGDYHLAAAVGWSLLGRPIDDAEMVECLRPARPHRYRTIRLLQITGQLRKPVFGPRSALTDHSWH